MAKSIYDTISMSKKLETDYLDAVENAAEKQTNPGFTIDEKTGESISGFRELYDISEAGNSYNDFLEGNYSPSNNEINLDTVPDHLKRYAKLYNRRGAMYNEMDALDSIEDPVHRQLESDSIMMKYLGYDLLKANYGYDLKSANWWYNRFQSGNYSNPLSNHVILERTLQQARSEFQDLRLAELNGGYFYQAHETLSELSGKTVDPSVLMSFKPTEFEDIAAATKHISDIEKGLLQGEDQIIRDPNTDEMVGFIGRDGNLYEVFSEEEFNNTQPSYDVMVYKDGDLYLNNKNKFLAGVGNFGRGVVRGLVFDLVQTVGALGGLLWDVGERITGQDDEWDKMADVYMELETWSAKQSWVGKDTVIDLDGKGNQWYDIAGVTGNILGAIAPAIISGGLTSAASFGGKASSVTVKEAAEYGFNTSFKKGVGELTERAVGRGMQEVVENFADDAVRIAVEAGTSSIDDVVLEITEQSAQDIATAMASRYTDDLLINQADDVINKQFRDEIQERITSNLLKNTGKKMSVSEIREVIPERFMRKRLGQYAMGFADNSPLRTALRETGKTIGRMHATWMGNPTSNVMANTAGQIAKKRLMFAGTHALKDAVSVYANVYSITGDDMEAFKSASTVMGINAASSFLLSGALSDSATLDFGKMFGKFEKAIPVNDIHKYALSRWVLTDTLLDGFDNILTMSVEQAGRQNDLSVENIIQNAGGLLTSASGATMLAFMTGMGMRGSRDAHVKQVSMRIDASSLDHGYRQELLNAFNNSSNDPELQATYAGVLEAYKQDVQANLKAGQKSDVAIWNAIQSSNDKIVANNPDIRDALAPFVKRVIDTTAKDGKTKFKETLLMQVNKSVEQLNHSKLNIFRSVLGGGLFNTVLQYRKNADPATMRYFKNVFSGINKAAERYGDSLEIPKIQKQFIGLSKEDFDSFKPQDDTLKTVENTAKLIEDNFDATINSDGSATFTLKGNTTAEARAEVETILQAMNIVNKIAESLGGDLRVVTFADDTNTPTFTMNAGKEFGRSLDALNQVYEVAEALNTLARANDNNATGFAESFAILTNAYKDITGSTVANPTKAKVLSYFVDSGIMGIDEALVVGRRLGITKGNSSFAKLVKAYNLVIDIKNNPNRYLSSTPHYERAKDILKGIANLDKTEYGKSEIIDQLVDISNKVVNDTLNNANPFPREAHLIDKNVEEVLAQGGIAYKDYLEVVKKIHELGRDFNSSNREETINFIERTTNNFDIKVLDVIFTNEDVKWSTFKSLIDERQRLKGDINSITEREIFLNSFDEVAIKRGLARYYNQNPTKDRYALRDIAGLSPESIYALYESTNLRNEDNSNKVKEAGELFIQDNPNIPRDSIVDAEGNYILDIELAALGSMDAVERFHNDKHFSKAFAFSMREAGIDAANRTNYINNRKIALQGSIDAFTAKTKYVELKDVSTDFIDFIKSKNKIPSNPTGALGTLLSLFRSRAQFDRVFSIVNKEVEINGKPVMTPTIETNFTELNKVIHEKFGRIKEKELMAEVKHYLELQDMLSTYSNDTWKAVVDVNKLSSDVIQRMKNASNRKVNYTPKVDPSSAFSLLESSRGTGMFYEVNHLTDFYENIIALREEHSSNPRLLFTDKAQFEEFLKLTGYNIREFDSDRHSVPGISTYLPGSVQTINEKGFTLKGPINSTITEKEVMNVHALDLHESLVEFLGGLILTDETYIRPEFLYDTLEVLSEGAFGDYLIERVKPSNSKLEGKRSKFADSSILFSTLTKGLSIKLDEAAHMYTYLSEVIGALGKDSEVINRNQSLVLKEEFDPFMKEHLEYYTKDGENRIYDVIDAGRGYYQLTNFNKENAIKLLEKDEFDIRLILPLFNPSINSPAYANLNIDYALPKSDVVANSTGFQSHVGTALKVGDPQKASTQYRLIEQLKAEDYMVKVSNSKDTSPMVFEDRLPTFGEVNNPVLRALNKIVNESLDKLLQTLGGLELNKYARQLLMDPALLSLIDDVEAFSKIKDVASTYHPELVDGPLEVQRKFQAANTEDVYIKENTFIGTHHLKEVQPMYTFKDDTALVQAIGQVRKFKEAYATSEDFKTTHAYYRSTPEVSVRSLLIQDADGNFYVPFKNISLLTEEEINSLPYNVRRKVNSVKKKLALVSPEKVEPTGPVQLAARVENVSAASLRFGDKRTFLGNDEKILRDNLTEYYKLLDSRKAYSDYYSNTESVRYLDEMENGIIDTDLRRFAFKFVEQSGLARTTGTGSLLTINEHNKRDAYRDVVALTKISKGAEVSLEVAAEMYYAVRGTKFMRTYPKYFLIRDGEIKATFDHTTMGIYRPDKSLVQLVNREEYSLDDLKNSRLFTLEKQEVNSVEPFVLKETKLFEDYKISDNETTNVYSELERIFFQGIIDNESRYPELYSHLINKSELNARAQDQLRQYYFSLKSPSEQLRYGLSQVYKVKTSLTDAEITAQVNGLFRAIARLDHTSTYGDSFNRGIRNILRTLDYSQTSPEYRQALSSRQSRGERLLINNLLYQDMSIDINESDLLSIRTLLNNSAEIIGDSFSVEEDALVSNYIHNYVNSNYPSTGGENLKPYTSQLEEASTALKDHLQSASPERRKEFHDYILYKLLQRTNKIPEAKNFLVSQERDIAPLVSQHRDGLTPMSSIRTSGNRAPLTSLIGKEAYWVDIETAPINDSGTLSSQHPFQVSFMKVVLQADGSFKFLGNAFSKYIKLRNIDSVDSAKANLSPKDLDKLGQGWEDALRESLTVGQDKDIVGPEIQAIIGDSPIFTKNGGKFDIPILQDLLGSSWDISKGDYIDIDDNLNFSLDTDATGSLKLADITIEDKVFDLYPPTVKDYISDIKNHDGEYDLTKSALVFTSRIISQSDRDAKLAAGFGKVASDVAELLDVDTHTLDLTHIPDLKHPGILSRTQVAETLNPILNLINNYTDYLDNSMSRRRAREMSEQRNFINLFPKKTLYNIKEVTPLFSKLVTMLQLTDVSNNSLFGDRVSAFFNSVDNYMRDLYQDPNGKYSHNQRQEILMDPKTYNDPHFFEAMFKNLYPYTIDDFKAMTADQVRPLPVLYTEAENVRRRIARDAYYPIFKGLEQFFGGTSNTGLFEGLLDRNSMNSLYNRLVTLVVDTKPGDEVERTSPLVRNKVYNTVNDLMRSATSKLFERSTAGAKRGSYNILTSSDMIEIETRQADTIGITPAVYKNLVGKDYDKSLGDPGYLLFHRDPADRLGSYIVLKMDVLEDYTSTNAIELNPLMADLVNGDFDGDRAFVFDLTEADSNAKPYLELISQLTTKTINDMSSVVNEARAALMVPNNSVGRRFNKLKSIYTTGITAAIDEYKNRLVDGYTPLTAEMMREKILNDVLSQQWSPDNRDIILSHFLNIDEADGSLTGIYGKRLEDVINGLLFRSVGNTEFFLGVKLDDYLTTDPDISKNAIIDATNNMFAKVFISSDSATGEVQKHSIFTSKDQEFVTDTPLRDLSVRALRINGATKDILNTWAVLDPRRFKAATNRITHGKFESNDADSLMRSIEGNFDLFRLDDAANDDFKNKLVAAKDLNLVYDIDNKVSMINQFKENIGSLLEPRDVASAPQNDINMIKLQKLIDLFDLKSDDAIGEYDIASKPRAVKVLFTNNDFFQENTGFFPSNSDMFTQTVTSVTNKSDRLFNSLLVGTEVLKGETIPGTAVTATVSGRIDRVSDDGRQLEIVSKSSDEFYKEAQDLKIAGDNVKATSSFVNAEAYGNGDSASLVLPLSLFEDFSKMRTQGFRGFVESVEDVDDIRIVTSNRTFKSTGKSAMMDLDVVEKMSNMMSKNDDYTIGVFGGYNNRYGANMLSTMANLYSFTTGLISDNIDIQGNDLVIKTPSLVKLYQEHDRNARYTDKNGVYEYRALRLLTILSLMTPSQLRKALGDTDVKAFAEDIVANTKKYGDSSISHATEKYLLDQVVVNDRESAVEILLSKASEENKETLSNILGEEAYNKLWPQDRIINSKGDFDPLYSKGDIRANEMNESTLKPVTTINDAMKRNNYMDGYDDIQDHYVSSREMLGLLGGRYLGLREAKEAAITSNIFRTTPGGYTRYGGNFKAVEDGMNNHARINPITETSQVSDPKTDFVSAQTVNRVLNRKYSAIDTDNLLKTNSIEPKHTNPISYEKGARLRYLMHVLSSLEKSGNYSADNVRNAGDLFNSGNNIHSLRNPLQVLLNNTKYDIDENGELTFKSDINKVSIDNSINEDIPLHKAFHYQSANYGETPISSEPRNRRSLAKYINLLGEEDPQGAEIDVSDFNNSFETAFNKRLQDLDVYEDIRTSYRLDSGKSIDPSRKNSEVFDINQRTSSNKVYDRNDELAVKEVKKGIGLDASKTKVTDTASKRLSRLIGDLPKLREFTEMRMNTKIVALKHAVKNSLGFTRFIEYSHILMLKQSGHYDDVKLLNSYSEYLSDFDIKDPEGTFRNMQNFLRDFQKNSDNIAAINKYHEIMTELLNQYIAYTGANKIDVYTTMLYAIPSERIQKTSVKTPGQVLHLYKQMLDPKTFTKFDTSERNFLVNGNPFEAMQSISEDISQVMARSHFAERVREEGYSSNGRVKVFAQQVMEELFNSSTLGKGKEYQKWLATTIDLFRKNKLENKILNDMLDSGKYSTPKQLLDDVNSKLSGMSQEIKQATGIEDISEKFLLKYVNETKENEIRDLIFDYLYLKDTRFGLMGSLVENFDKLHDSDHGDFLTQLRNKFSDVTITDRFLREVKSGHNKRLLHKGDFTTLKENLSSKNTVDAQARFLLEALDGELYETNSSLVSHMDKYFFTKRAPGKFMETLDVAKSMSVKLIMGSLPRFFERAFSRFAFFDTAMLSMQNPKTMLFLPKAAKIMRQYQASNRQVLDPDLEGYLKYKGFDAFEAKHRDFLDRVEEYKGFRIPGLSNVNEHVLEMTEWVGDTVRFASFLANLNDFNKGKTLYGNTYKNKEFIDSIEDPYYKAWQLVSHALPTPGDLPYLAKQLNPFMVFTSFPLGQVRAGSDWISSGYRAINDLVRRGDTSGMYSSFLLPSGGIAGMFLVGNLLLNVIGEMYNVDEDQVEEWKKEQVTIDPFATSLFGSPVDRPTWNPLTAMYNDWIKPFVEGYEGDPYDDSDDSILNAALGGIVYNNIAKANPLFKIPLESITGYDLFGGHPFSTKDEYNLAENLARKTLGIAIGNTSMNSILDSLRTAKYTEDPISKDLLYAMGRGLADEFGNARAYKQNKKDYYNARGLVAQYLSAEKEDSLEEISLYDSYSNSYNYDTETAAELTYLFKAAMDREESSSIIYAIILDALENGVDETTITIALNRVTVSGLLGKIDNMDNFLNSLTYRDRLILDNAIHYEKQNFPSEAQRAYYPREFYEGDES